MKAGRIEARITPVDPAHGFPFIGFRHTAPKAEWMPRTFILFLAGLIVAVGIDPRRA